MSTTANSKSHRDHPRSPLRLRHARRRPDHPGDQRRHSAGPTGAVRVQRADGLCGRPLRSYRTGATGLHGAHRPGRQLSRAAQPLRRRPGPRVRRYPPCAVPDAERRRHRSATARPGCGLGARGQRRRSAGDVAPARCRCRDARGVAGRCRPDRRIGGSICWHVGGTTDSFGPDLRPSPTDSPWSFSNGVHYDSEPQRRPFFSASSPTAPCPPVTPPTTAPVSFTVAPNSSRLSVNVTAPQHISSILMGPEPWSAVSTRAASEPTAPTTRAGLPPNR